MVHDWLRVYGGAERCVESFTNIWDDFDVFSLIDFLSEDDRESILKGKNATTSFIQKLPFAKEKYRNYMPLFPIAVEQFDMREYDLVLSSSHAVAKGVLTTHEQLHICYLYSPMRYAWDLYFGHLEDAGLSNGLKNMAARYFLHKIRLWDFVSANRPDHYIAISKYIAKRAKKTYGREADVIYPPVDTGLFNICEKQEDYYVTSSRLVPYKKVDLIVEALSETKHKLIVIGNGPEMEKIKAKAGKNIELLGYQSQEEMIKIIQSAKAYIFAADEDFGIAPIEAQAAGVPVIAFGKGAALETIVGGFDTGDTISKNDTGIFFERQSVESLLCAIELFERNIDIFDKQTIRQNALRFGRDRFEREIQEYVDRKYEEFRAK